MSESAGLRRSAWAAAVAIGLAVALSLPAAAVEPQLAGTPGWAWVVARQPTAAAYVPAPKDQGNSSDAVNSVERAGPGSYRVTFGDRLTSNVVIHVSPLGTAPRTCIVDDWAPAGGDLVAEVDCRGRTGAPADTAFVVNMLSLTDLLDDAGFVVGNQPGTADYVPEIRANTLGGTNSIHRIGTGRWQVSMPDLGGALGRGGAQVTAGGIPGAACRVAGWTAGIQLTVVCRDGAGTLLDTSFHLTYTLNRGLAFHGERHAAYLRADRPTARTYGPAAGYWFSTSGRKPAIRRTGKGAYTVTLAGQPLGGSAQVSAFGGGSNRCVVAGIEKQRKPQRVRVRCFTADGSAPADARFLLHYLR